MMQKDAAAHTSKLESLMELDETLAGKADEEIHETHDIAQPDFVRQVQKDFYMGKGAPKSLSESLKKSGKKI